MPRGGISKRSAQPGGGGGGGGGSDGNGAFVARLMPVGNHGLAGLAPIDGVVPLAGDTIFVGEQTLPAENGIWTAAAGAWTRDTNANTSPELVGTQVRVVEGALHSGGLFWLETNQTIVVGVTPQHWVRFGLYGMVDPRSFGALSDGVTNDYAAWTAALNAAITTNLPMYVPPGTTLVLIPNVAGTYQSPSGAGSVTFKGEGPQISTVLFSTVGRGNVTVGGFIGFNENLVGTIVRIESCTWACDVGGLFATVGVEHIGNTPPSVVGAIFERDAILTGWGNTTKMDDNGRTSSGKVDIRSSEIRGGFSGTLAAGAPSIILDQGYDPLSAFLYVEDTDLYNAWSANSNGAHCVYCPAGTGAMFVRCRFWQALVYGVTAFSGTGDGVARFEQFVSCYFHSAVGAAYSSNNGCRAIFTMCVFQGCPINIDAVPISGVTLMGCSWTGLGTSCVEETGPSNYIDITGGRMARQNSGANVIRNASSIAGATWLLDNVRFEGGDISAPRLNLLGGTTKVRGCVFHRATVQTDGVLLAKATNVANITYEENTATVDGTFRDASIAMYGTMTSTGGGNYSTTVSSVRIGLDSNGTDITGYARFSVAAGPQTVYYRTNPDGTGALLLFQSTRSIMIPGVAAPAGTISAGVEGIDPVENAVTAGSAIADFQECEFQNGDSALLFAGTSAGYLRDCNFGAVISSWLFCRADADAVRLHGWGNRFPAHPTTGGGLAPVNVSGLALGDIEPGQGTYGSAAAPIASAVSLAASTNHNVMIVNGAAAIERIFYPNSGFTGTRFFVGTELTIIPAAGSAFTTVLLGGLDGQFVFLTSLIARVVGIPITFKLIDPGGGGVVGWYEI